MATAEAILAAPGNVVVDRDESGWLVLHTETKTPQLLAVAESSHPGWQAWVDGRAVPVVRVNGDFLGCRVAAGEHRVELDFRPLSLRMGAIISSLGLGLIVGLACLFGRRAGVLRSKT